MESPLEIIKQAGRSLVTGLTGKESVYATVIKTQGEKNAPGCARGLGCIGQAIGIATGTTILFSQTTQGPSPENVVPILCTGFGLIFFSLFSPVISKLFKK